jgi:hypothetical protein
LSKQFGLLMVSSLEIARDEAELLPLPLLSAMQAPTRALYEKCRTKMGAGSLLEPLTKMLETILREGYPREASTKESSSENSDATEFSCAETHESNDREDPRREGTKKPVWTICANWEPSKIGSLPWLSSPSFESNFSFEAATVRDIKT